jgi:tRNA pseudouridine55 synthase
MMDKVLADRGLSAPNAGHPSRNHVRRPRHAVDGVLLLDKPVGPSSTRALGHVKHLLQAAKAGHGGTLDPMASGLLPLMFGEATKYAAEGLDADKSYEATLMLGIKTDTADAEGDVIQTASVPELTAAQVSDVVAQFAGEQQQVPPMFSALKKDGRSLYSYARKGESVERAPRTIQIRRIEVRAFTPPELSIFVRCSKGTYIRTLAEDIGQALGTVAHLKSLRRVGVGQLVAQDMVCLETIEQANEADRLGLLKPVDWLIRDWPALVLGPQQVKRFTNGQPVMLSDQVTAGLYRIRSEQDQFLGTGRVDLHAMLHPDRVRVISH